MSVKVLHYYKHCDIPQRGILSVDGARHPFTAELIQEADDEEWSKGIPTKLQTYLPMPSLEPEFEFIETRFWEWKARNDGSQHPLIWDSQYKEALGKIDAGFETLGTSIRVMTGYFSHDGKSWNFESGGQSISPCNAPQ